jgi:hypothetical protein
MKPEEKAAEEFADIAFKLDGIFPAVTEGLKFKLRAAHLAGQRVGYKRGYMDGFNEMARHKEAKR